MIESGRLMPIARHQPGTSYPRHANVISFLQDLGYVSSLQPYNLTSDGESLLQEIDRGPAGAL
jgi:hypothetical protein